MEPFTGHHLYDVRVELSLRGQARAAALEPCTLCRTSLLSLMSEVQAHMCTRASYAAILPWSVAGVWLVATVSILLPLRASTSTCRCVHPSPRPAPHLTACVQKRAQLRWQGSGAPLSSCTSYHRCILPRLRSWIVPRAIDLSLPLHVVCARQQWRLERRRSTPCRAALVVNCPVPSAQGLGGADMSKRRVE